MIDKQQYQRAFGVLHASGDFLKEDFQMRSRKQFSARRIVVLCAVVILVLSMSIVCYAEDVGGIRRTIQIWIHGDQTNAVMDHENGEYTISYEDPDGTLHSWGGGGVAIEPDGSERPLTEAEILEHLSMPEVVYKKDGTVWVYYQNQALEITNLFQSDGVCFVQLKDGEDVLYLTVKYQNGYATSPSGFIQPEEFN